MKNIMNYDEFIEFLESKESETERKELSDFFTEERKSRKILSFEEWSNQDSKEFLFLTYDLINLKGNNSYYTPINDFIENTLHFDRQINNRRLTNNCFVAFPAPINSQVMVNYAQRLNNFFSIHLSDFRIYLNIAKDFDLHP